MSIPIGPRDNNYGVIKVVNSEFRSRWFTDYDERLATELALRLHVIIEKFLHIKETEDASAESKRQAQIAEQHAKQALIEKSRAEEGEMQRQQDLLTITHQVQGPLIPVIGTLSSLSQAPIPRVFKERLEHAQALVEDAFTLCYGTFTTFAVEAKQKPASVAESINAPAELRKLSQRLKRTNSRADLNFTFKDAPDFPILNMDRNIFTSVFYSLIHNAMKYANESSNVTLECGFEDPGRRPVLKVRSYGEPIHPSERESIFIKFSRGRAVEKGRHHRGVGLGLWVARELMRYIHGDLTVELSPYDPTMAVFIVHIPQTA
jgi:K+-sensing histidine kinase KdpD